MCTMEYWEEKGLDSEIEPAWDMFKSHVTMNTACLGAFSLRGLNCKFEASGIYHLLLRIQQLSIPKSKLTTSSEYRSTFSGVLLARVELKRRDGRSHGLC